LNFLSLKQRVCEANLLLPKLNLILFTWGNVSEFDRENGFVAIKPSGVEYVNLTANDIVVLDLDGNIVDGKLNPSSDTPSHLELYRRFPNIRGVTHTHSRYATIFAQRKESIPEYGTTHADYFHGEVPCARPLTPEEVAVDYELNTGRVIVECCHDYMGVPAMLVANHGVFAWGKDSIESVHNAAVLEEIACMAWHCRDVDNVEQYVLDKHYYRKHGANAYYGQKH
jgi:L-ribulose-5-phosphate 4-epimerase